ncbi:MAG: MFS transporter [Cyanobacteria bacterium P01_A01_bin.123]
MERLSPQLQGTAARIIQLIDRYHGGGSHATPMGMLNQTIASTSKDVKRVKHAFGETEVPANPTRVIALGYTTVEAVVAHGVQPIGVPSGVVDELRHLSLDRATMSEAGDPNQPNLEKIAALKPDLILTSKYRIGDGYGQLTRIAPTVVLDIDGSAEWKELTRLCGEALGKSTETEKLTATYAAKVQQVKDQLSQKATQPQVSIVSILPGLIRASGTEPFAGSVLADAGIARPPSQSQAQGPQNVSLESLFESLQLSGSYIVAPAIAGSIYAITGLRGILVIDLVTFAIAIATLSLVAIPQPRQTEHLPHQSAASETVLQQLTFGIRYLWQRPNLRTLLSFFLISNFIDSASFSLLPPMVLARSGSDAAMVGTLFSCFGVGGVLGGLTLSLWGGPKRRIHGVLITSAIWKVGLLILALAQNTATKMGTALVSGFCSPFPGSCSQAIWRAKVEPEVQGRVFATRFLLTQLATPLDAAISGPLADHVFEPAMQPGETLSQLFGGIFGTGPGASMALQMTLFASCGVLVTAGGYRIRRLRQVELSDVG